MSSEPQSIQDKNEPSGGFPLQLIILVAVIGLGVIALILRVLGIV